MRATPRLAGAGVEGKRERLGSMDERTNARASRAESGTRPGAPRPLVVLEGPAGSSLGDLERLRATGATIVEGFRPPLGRGSVVCTGIVDDTESAAAALLAAIDGHGLIIEVRAEQAVADRLVDDLRRLGPVDHRIGAADAAPSLDRESRAILGLLAEGHSLGEAAHLLGLARRTADRRLAAARLALGVDRTTEAISRARRLGWLGHGHGPGPGSGRAGGSG